MNEQELSEWVRTQFQRANQHLAENGLLFKSIATEESRYLAPEVAVWKITVQDGKRYWVLSGDVPIDYIAEGCAPNAREALKYISYQWQMRVENIQRQENKDPTEMEFANLLERKATLLYDISMDEKLWQSV